MCQSPTMPQQSFPTFPDLLGGDHETHLFSNFVQTHASEIWVSNHSAVETHPSFHCGGDAGSELDFWLQIVQTYKPTSFIPWKGNLDNPLSKEAGMEMILYPNHASPSHIHSPPASPSLRMCVFTMVCASSTCQYSQLSAAPSSVLPVGENLVKSKIHSVVTEAKAAHFAWLQSLQGVQWRWDGDTETSHRTQEELAQGDCQRTVF